ncbi:hypothetical protein NDU88_006662 [Pleurodeles waltl]|uniref:Uncharacterized protein n=1 Tax=Pleurodeles waltl TaxID=8319 RepID=A0AAV7N323_PLEWA|nr:hypothetical protein NDU88_006662 [Pleurodeles waltl]
MTLRSPHLSSPRASLQASAFSLWGPPGVRTGFPQVCTAARERLQDIFIGEQGPRLTPVGVLGELRPGRCGICRGAGNAEKTRPPLPGAVALPERIICRTEVCFALAATDPEKRPTVAGGSTRRPGPTCYARPRPPPDGSLNPCSRCGGSPDPTPVEES